LRVIGEKEWKNDPRVTWNDDGLVSFGGMGLASKVDYCNFIPNGIIPSGIIPPGIMPVANVQQLA